MEFDDIIEFLESKGFYRVAVNGPHKQIWANEDMTINVTIEESISKMTPEEEEQVRQRLISLGYL